MKKDKKDTAFQIFFSVCVFLSVYVYALMSKLTGDPATKLFADVLVIALLVVLNTTVLIMHEKIRDLKK